MTMGGFVLFFLFFRKDFSINRSSLYWVTWILYFTQCFQVEHKCVAISVQSCKGKLCPWCKQTVPALPVFRSQHLVCSSLFHLPPHSWSGVSQLQGTGDIQNCPHSLLHDPCTGKAVRPGWWPMVELWSSPSPERAASHQQPLSLLFCLIICEFLHQDRGMCECYSFAFVGLC